MNSLISNNTAILKALLQATRAVKTVEEPIAVAAGGNGIVYRVIDSNGNWLAIKIPRFDLLSERRVAIARNCLLREREVLAHTQTDHIPRLIAFDANGTFLVRDYIQGRLLDELVYDLQVDQFERVQVSLKVVEAAGALWQQFHDWPAGAYVIRDFKPRNLVFDYSQRRVSLVDVGSVRSESSMLTKNQRFHRIGSGAWRYWSPEQLLEDRNCLDRRTDYFSLGSTLYALLFGDPPFLNSAPASEFHASYQKEHKDALRHLGLAFWVPSSLRDFIEMCIRPDPCARPTHVPSLAALS